jgi:general secretion pathway protein J
MSRPFRPQAGFTLLEIIIAVGIFAVVSALAYGGLNTILRTTQKTQEANRDLQSLQLAMSIIQQDLTQITNRPVRNDYGEKEAAVLSPGTFGRLISFTRRGWKNPANRPRSTLQRVAYLLEDETLVREYWPQLDAAPGVESIKLPLLDGITEIKFRFLDDNQRWQTEWPPISSTQKILSPPRAVEITLVTEKWGSIPRLFLL